MSTELQKQLTAVGSYLFKTGMAGLVALALLIFNDMRADIKTMSAGIGNMRDLVIKHEGDIDRSKKDIDRLERTKADKK